MSVATKAKALVSRAAAAVAASMVDQQAKADTAKAVLIAAQAAYEAALGRAEIGDGTEEEAEQKKVELDKAKRDSERADAGLARIQTLDSQKAEKAAADRKAAALLDARRYDNEREALVERYVADCKRIESTVTELLQVGHKLDAVSASRRASTDLRELIVGPAQVSRLLAIMRGLIPSLHKQPGVQPHERGIEQFIKNEINMGRPFSDRPLKGE